MKKFRLNTFQFDQSAILSRSQLKNIVGGSAAFCEARCTCPDGFTIILPAICSNSCSAQDGVGTTCNNIGQPPMTTTCGSSMDLCPTPPGG